MKFIIERKMQTFKIIIIGIVFNLSLSSFAQNADTVSINIEITQNVLPGPNPEIKYVIENRHFYIYQIDTRYKDTTAINSSKKIYAISLNSSQMDSLARLSEIIMNSRINNKYETAVIDGVNWNFKINYNKIEKNIFIDNCRVALLDSLLIYLNRQLPEKKRIISFDLLSH